METTSTSLSAIAAMTIGIDIDDTLTNTYEHMIPYVAHYCGRKEEDLRREGISYENVPPEWGIDFRVMWRAIFDTAVPLTPPKEGAKEALEKIRKAGHRIVIITARTNDFYTDCYKTTVGELQNLGFVYDKLICSYGKDKACLEEGIEVFIDDSVDNCLLVSKVGVKTYMMESHFNGEVSLPGIRKVSGWKEFLEELGIEE